MRRLSSYSAKAIYHSFSLLFRSSERGSAAVETALLLPMILAVGFLCVDLYKISVERTRMEQLAGSASMTLAVQKKLGQAGLDGLYDTMLHIEGLKDVRGRHQMIVTNVTMPSRRIWWTLSKGAEDVCDEAAEEGAYPGPLPDPVIDDGREPSEDSYSLVVVQLCRNVNDISMDYLALPDRLVVTSINRASSLQIDLDALLLAQASGAIVTEKNP